jgi:hypothetical protein
MQYSDVQAYGTGVLYTYLIGYTMTLRECAEFLIKKSDNTAWKMLDRYLGRDYIRAELYRAGARSSQYWLPNTTTPNDVLLMLEKMSNRSYTPLTSRPRCSTSWRTQASRTASPNPFPKGRGSRTRSATTAAPSPTPERSFPKARHKGRLLYRGCLLYSRDGERDGLGDIACRHVRDVPRHLPHPVRAHTRRRVKRLIVDPG